MSAFEKCGAQATTWGRPAASSYLPDAFAADPDRLARFQREAQVLASLNHPGIAAIYGLEKSDDTQALVLELVEGPTLADRIAKGPIPLDEALPIAKQIAEALEAAHEAGVIHRDLKPANIKVREDGTVKVLDFGLAKASQPEASGMDAASSPTVSLTAAATQMGMVIGTAAYMAPEQAKGLPADKRADIWAFGAVVYEMLTGRRPFGGDDVSDTLAAVLRDQVDWTALPVATPSALRRLLKRCLERDRKNRLRDIGEARFALDELFRADAPVRGEPDTAVSQGSTRVRHLVMGALAGAAVATLISVVAPLGRSESSSESTPTVGLTRRFEIVAPRRSFAGQDLAISPDGSQLVFPGLTEEGSPVLFRRDLATLESEPLRGTEGARLPFFSPDGGEVGFFGGTGLRRMPIEGGLAVTVIDAADQHLPLWTYDDRWILGQDRGPLLGVSVASGGTPEPVTMLADGEVGHRFAHELPGGRGLLFTVFGSGALSEQVAVQPPDGGPHLVLTAGSRPALLPTGHLVVSRQFTLWAAPFDLDRLELTAEPVPVLQGVGSGFGGFSAHALATDGTLVYIPRVSRTSRVVWLEPDGSVTPIGNEPPALYHSPLELSPDDRQLAVTRHREDGNDEILLIDLERDASRLLVSSMVSRWPVWTPDGSRLTFASTEAGSWDIYDLALDGSADPTALLVRDEFLIPLSWSPDRRILLLLEGPESAGGRVWALSEDADPELVDGIRDRAELSPAGGWVAFESRDMGQREIYVRTWPELGPPERVSPAGGFAPRWARDGRDLFYATADGVDRVTFDPDGAGIGRPERFVTATIRGDGGRGYDVTTDGSRAIALIPEQQDETSRYRIVLNWHRELLERVPID